MTAVRHASLSIEPGTFVSLLGPSGSGKTTTLMMVAGFVEPDEGEIFIDGRDVQGVPPHHRNLGVVFQSYALFPHLTVAENVSFPLAMRRLPRQEARRIVAEALELVSLGGLANRKPRELSGGQQQRVALARALVFRPRVLLMDEPLGALDKNLRTQMQDEISRLQRQLGVTVLYVTHDQGEALTLSSQIAVFRDGQIVQAAAPETLYREPRSAFVASFVGEANLTAGTIGEARGAAYSVDLSGGRRIESPGVPGLAGGSQVAVVTRPEWIDIAPPEGGAGDGVVRTATFAGEHVRLTVETESGSTLTATVSSRRELRIGEGDRVQVDWVSADTWVVPAE